MLLSLVGIAGGFFIVPVNALIQYLPDRKEKGSVMAANGWLNSFGAFLAALLFFILKRTIGVEANVILLVMGGSDGRRDRLCGAARSGFSRAPAVMGAHQHALPECACSGRDNIPEKGGGTAGIEPHVDGGRDVPDRFDAPPHPLHHAPRSVQQMVGCARSRKHVEGDHRSPPDLRPREMLAAFNDARQSVSRNG